MYTYIQTCMSVYVSVCIHAYTVYIYTIHTYAHAHRRAHTYILCRGIGTDVYLPTDVCFPTDRYLTSMRDLQLKVDWGSVYRVECRGNRIRTYDLYIPNVTHCRAMQCPVRRTRTWNAKHVRHTRRDKSRRSGKEITACGTGVNACSVPYVLHGCLVVRSRHAGLPYR